MRLFEYQAKEMFKKAGISVPRGAMTENQSGIESAIDAVGCPCVVKAQVARGGRGKEGLIQFAADRREALAQALAMMDKRGVRRLLIEEALAIERELYLAVTFDPVTASALIMASPEGGVDIEELARTRPNLVFKMRVDVFRRLSPFQARDLMFQIGLKGAAFKQGLGIVGAMFDLFRRRDAELVEINPLVLTRDGGLVAADGKLLLDDNASFRQEKRGITREHFDSDLEYEATLEGIPCLRFDGAIGLMCAGAGLTNTIYDLISYEGGSVANYLEFGGPNYRRAEKAMELTMKSNPKVILIVTFGTIARADVMAQGIVDAIVKLKPGIPIITAIRGTGEEDAARILRGAGLDPLADTEDAVRKAVALSGGKKQ